MTLSIDNLTHLKACSKRIIKLVPRQQKSQYNQKQQTIIVVSEEGDIQFEIFIRQNMDILINFTAGLKYIAPDNATYLLCRYNGDHGEHKNALSGEKLRGFHKHLYKLEYIEEGLSDDSYAETTTAYATLTQAIQQLCIDYNIVNFEDYFPIDRQTSLF